MIAYVTSEMTKEKDRMRQEFSTRLQSIAKEVEVVKESADLVLTNCVRNFDSVCDGMNESMNAYKSQTDASLVSG
jgi:hypothetical protein